MQTTLRNIFFFSLLWCCFFTSFAQRVTSEKQTDSLRVKTRDSLTNLLNKQKYIYEDAIIDHSSDSLKTSKEVNLTEIDTIKNDTIQKKGFLAGDVVYSAKNYMRLNRLNNKMYLYDDAKVDYTDMNIEAGAITINQQKKEVYAKGIVDTAEVYTQTPVFKQGSNLVEPDTIRFNFESKKALIYNSKTNQDGFNILNEVSKRENDSVVYMKNVRFTTSENIEDPEYYFYARRIKFMPQKKIVTGLVNMYIAGVPTPLGLPFAYFPMVEDAASGFILPSFNDSDSRGFELQNGGYYFAINDYVNLTVVGNYSTNTSFAIRTESNYAKRYRYSGNVNLRFENNITSERGLDDFSKATEYNIQWSHRRAAQANPNSTFSASVNFGSSQFFNNSTNQSNIGAQLNSDLSSSISYSRSIRSEPEISIDTSLRISQNTQTEVISINTPLNVSTGRVYPLAPKTGTKKGLIQNINLQATSRAENRISTTDDDFLTAQMLRDAENGISHTVPISTNFKLFKYLNGSASTSIRENWVFETIDQSYDEVEEEVVRDTIQGFDRFHTYNFSTSLGTTVYGSVQFNKDAKIKALRHVIRPSVSYSYTPAFDQFYDSYIIPANDELDEDREIVDYSRFSGGFFSAPGNTEGSSLSFSVGNTLEAKVADRDTTNIEAKKVTILNALNFSSGYDFKADSLKLRAISVSGSIPIVEKLTLNFNGTLDPYALNDDNQRIDTWNINNGGSLFRLTGGGLSFGYSFSSQDIENKRKEKEDENETENETFRNGGRPDDLFGSNTNYRNGDLFNDEPETPEEKKNKTDIDFYNYKVPWSLQFSYNLRYSNAARQDEISSHTINFSGDVELAPRWKVGASSGYNVLTKEITFTNLRFQRDLESWKMSFNWVPFSTTTSWNFFIGITSNVLSDIKWDKRGETDKQL